MAQSNRDHQQGGGNYNRFADPGEQPEKDPRRVKKPRQFEVIGPHEVGGAVKGQRVSLDLTDGQAAVLIEAGHVILVSDQGGGGGDTGHGGGGRGVSEEPKSIDPVPETPVVPAPVPEKSRKAKP